MKNILVKFQIQTILVLQVLRGQLPPQRHPSQVGITRHQARLQEIMSKTFIKEMSKRTSTLTNIRDRFYDVVTTMKDILMDNQIEIIGEIIKKCCNIYIKY